MLRIAIFAAVAVVAATVAVVTTAAVVSTDAVGTTDDKTPKVPPLDSKEWKKLGDTGVEVWEVKEGTGTEVKKGDTVKVNYIGWLTTGEVFDSSKSPVEFGLDQLIKGWQAGIPGMKPGGVRRLKIPPELGYGAKTLPGIPANSTLVFEITLVPKEK